MPESLSREPGFEESPVRIPFATVSKFGHFRSLHDAPVHSAVFINEYLAIDSGGHVIEWSSCSICSMAECFSEKSSWCRNEQVCKALGAVQQTGYHAM